MQNKEFVKKIENAGHEIGMKVEGYKTSAFSKFPSLFIGLSTFGFVATLYGFEKIIDSIPFLADKPIFILGSGLLALVVTGTLYKKLN